MLAEESRLTKQRSRDQTYNAEYLRALGGYLLVLDNSADIVYVSPDVTKLLGINQVRASCYVVTRFPCPLTPSLLASPPNLDLPAALFVRKERLKAAKVLLLYRLVSYTTSIMHCTSTGETISL